MIQYSTQCLEDAFDTHSDKYTSLEDFIEGLNRPGAQMAIILFHSKHYASECRKIHTGNIIHITAKTQSQAITTKGKYVHPPPQQRIGSDLGPLIRLITWGCYGLHPDTGNLSAFYTLPAMPCGSERRLHLRYAIA